MHFNNVYLSKLGIIMTLTGYSEMFPLLITASLFNRGDCIKPSATNLFIVSRWCPV